MTQFSNVFVAKNVQRKTGKTAFLYLEKIIDQYTLPTKQRSRPSFVIGLFVLIWIASQTEVE